MGLKECDLASTVNDLDTLWATLDKVRSTSKAVTVDKRALTAVLLDHSRMARELFGKDVLPRGIR
jgi:hypothetical protein